MTAPSNTSFDWVREIKPNLAKIDSIPLTGNSPPFPWEDFSLRLARSFERENLKIEPGEICWRSKEDLYEGLGTTLFPLIFSIPSLKGQVCWVMPAQEMDVLAALLLTKDSHPLTFHDPDLTESFYHFLALEVLYHFTQVAFDPTLTPILTNQTALPDQDSLCKDIQIHLQGQTIWGRLIISPEFRRSWVEHFAQKSEPSQLSQEMTQLINVNVHLEVGKCLMSLKEWQTIQLGDFILLDSCSLDSEKLSGRILLTINNRPAFRAKLKDGTLKILELPLLHEVYTPMAKEPEIEDDDDDLSDLDFPEDHDDDDEKLDEDLFEDKDENSLSEEKKSENQIQTDVSAEPDTQKEIAKTSEPIISAKASSEGPISPQQIPLNLIVEVGQIQMSVEQLLKLEPGNLLEIDIHPENGVNLTINGRIVGKGELIRIGEAIGVRVLQLGR